MNISTTDVESARASRVEVSEESLTVDLVDGRTIAVPTAWYPRLLHCTPQQRNHWRIIGAGEGIHWPDVDEDVSAENLLAGRPSGESQRSFQRWLDERRASSES